MIALLAAEQKRVGEERTAAMTPVEAVTWLREVDAELYRTPSRRRGRAAWVAVVRTPRVGNGGGRTIIALGETLQEAANTAARQWREALQERGPLH